MDLLSAAYSSTASDEEEDDDEAVVDGLLPTPPPKRQKPVYPNVHTPKPDYPIHSPKPSPQPVVHRPILPAKNLQREAPNPVPGRYISKRERAALAPDPAPPAPKNPCPSPAAFSGASPPAIVGSILDAKLPSDILSLLRNPSRSHKQTVRTFERPISLNSHVKAVSSIQWSPSHSHLLASAGMDQTICIWNVWSRDQKKARVLNNHNAAVKDVKWSPEGLSVLSCGYDCSSRLTDVETGIVKQVFVENQVVGVAKFHPRNFNLFLSGGSKGLLKLWDIRSGKVVHEYLRNLGPVLDIEFMIEASQFISSSDVSRSNLSENSIIVWDVSRQVPLSNQVYVEAYTVPCIRCHPFEPYFVAQSNGNYIAIFSIKPPFKLDKYKRFEGHGVFGFPIKCNFSLDGQKLITGSSDGFIYLYNFRSSALICKVKVYEQACTDVIFHPLLPNLVASCNWNGDISVFKWDGTSCVISSLGSV